MILKISNQYFRKGNILYENNIPIIKLKQNFCNIEIISENAIDYMNRYLEMFPELYETIEEKTENKTQQISLF